MTISLDGGYHTEGLVVDHSGLCGFNEYTCTNCIDVKDVCYGCQ